MQGRKKAGKTDSHEYHKHFEEEWKFIERSFQRLLELVDSGYKAPPDHNDFIKQNMETYTRVYNLCTKNDSAKCGVQAAGLLYGRSKEMIEKYLDSRVTKNVVNKKGEELLKQLYKAWESHQLVVKWGRFMFHYLDIYYTKHNQVDNLRVMMLRCFNSAVYEKIKVDLCDVLLKEVEKERGGNTIDRIVMKEAINLFVEMGLESNHIYEHDFETPFLEQTAKYYQRMSASWLSEDGGIHTYLKRVENSLNQEQQRSLSYLHSTSETHVISRVEQELLTEHKARVLEDPDAGTQALLANWKTEDLGRMFQLFARIHNGLDKMSEIVREYIKEEGKAINKKFSAGEVDQKGYIDASLELHDKYTGLFREFFNNNSHFFKARKSAFEVFINETLAPPKGDNQKITSSELLSSYCDNMMKNEKITPDELEATLEKIVELFTYISDKDLFQEFYRKQMSKRLLVSKTDNDNERSLISKLKLKMGAPYTSKLEGMITDKNLGAETQKSFLEYCKHKGKTVDFDFTTQVLTTGYWPAFKIDPLNPPTELASNMASFTEFYNQKTKSRVLKWVHSLGTATLAAKFNKGNKEVIVSTFQACVLLSYNSKINIQASDLAKEYALPFEEIKRTIHSLAFGKFTVLKRNAAGKKVVAESDIFHINEDFHTPQRKFKIPGVTRAVPGDPHDKTDESRRHVTEACIVRTMKARKQLSHNEV
eukprot:TRINITY_DN66651_c3_g5_i2.p1 TRINITY_DN66651_c3_g5~~TRINITY_DN66651_c3_g5_i2.p1  ORF type:complete len:707 (+),score=124.19 TRINITY_DN66651_c3_g5_i2:117-2237(+)